MTAAGTWDSAAGLESETMMPVWDETGPRDRCGGDFHAPFMASHLEADWMPWRKK